MEGSGGASHSGSASDAIIIACLCNGLDGVLLQMLTQEREAED